MHSLLVDASLGLVSEQAKLTQAYLADALPLEALKAEQGRIQRELGQARTLIGQYQQDYEAIEAALDHALLMCRYGALAYEHAEPEVRRQLVQAAFDKLWVVDTEIVGVDLKPGFVTLLDDELERQAGEKGIDRDLEPVSGKHEGATYYRRDRSFGLTVADLEIRGIPTAEEDLWLPVERPSGRLPWEAKDPSVFAGVRGSNMTDLVGAGGFEPPASRL
jgi:site-specific DNA recombinase